MELLANLRIVKRLEQGPATTQELGEMLLCSDRTLKRYISDARALGARIESHKTEGGLYHWYLVNKKQIQDAGIVDKWYALELAASVRNPKTFTSPEIQGELNL